MVLESVFTTEEIAEYLRGHPYKITLTIVRECYIFESSN